MSLKGAVERVSIFEISEFGEEKKIALFLPSSLPLLLHSSLAQKSKEERWLVLLDTLFEVKVNKLCFRFHWKASYLMEVQLLASSLAGPIVLNLMLRTSIAVT